MAKGQLHGNREAKKPKQDKKPTAPASPLAAGSKSASTMHEPKKK